MIPRAAGAFRRSPAVVSLATLSTLGTLFAPRTRLEDAPRTPPEFPPKPLQAPEINPRARLQQRADRAYNLHPPPQSCHNIQWPSYSLSNPPPQSPPNDTMPSLPALAPQLLLSIIALFPAIWLYTAYMSRAQFPSLHAARILLLIAHPDDEAMFFAPTVQALCRPGQGNHVKILCLSTGDADGLGETRKREIRDSAKRLGVRDEADVFVLDDKCVILLISLWLHARCSLDARAAANEQSSPRAHEHDADTCNTGTYKTASPGPHPT